MEKTSFCTKTAFQDSLDLSGESVSSKPQLDSESLLMSESRPWSNVVTRNLALIFLLLLASCQDQDVSDVRAPDSEQLSQEYAVLEQLRQAIEDSSNDDFSGEWIDGDGARICDGYLTRLGNEEFCEASIPDNWTPFEFNGQTYHRQPLAGHSDQPAEPR